MPHFKCLNNKCIKFEDFLGSIQTKKYILYIMYHTPELSSKIGFYDNLDDLIDQINTYDAEDLVDDPYISYDERLSCVSFELYLDASNITAWYRIYNINRKEYKYVVDHFKY
ncbi:MAG: hypothetical protein Satyrvirus7_8 [Satyrvirus sp.]|uniref:Uncharacterized protein n=1 Tax=Satyrvirus sp. TaxID=2487771 RepID=A0A3G5AF50_9VIRU|nr:MAG: hypothetical protein Satyrvirus7_8 [Satyrvirus sp.]